MHRSDEKSGLRFTSRTGYSEQKKYRVDTFIHFKKESCFMKYLHTMIRVSDIDAALDFFVGKLGMVETRR